MLLHGSEDRKASALRSDRPISSNKEREAQNLLRKKKKEERLSKMNVHETEDTKKQAEIGSHGSNDYGEREQSFAER